MATVFARLKARALWAVVVPLPACLPAALCARASSSTQGHPV